MEPIDTKNFVVVIIGSRDEKDGEVTADAISNNLGLLNLKRYFYDVLDFKTMDEYWYHMKMLAHESKGYNLVFLYDNKIGVCVYADSKRDGEVIEENLSKIQKQIQDHLDWLGQGRKCIKVYGFDASRYERQSGFNRLRFNSTIPWYVKDISIKIKHDLNI